MPYDAGMSTFESLSEANNALEDADRRLSEYYAKHGIEDGAPVLPDSEELRQIIADREAAQKAQTAFINRL